MRNRINESIENFIKENEESGVVKQLKKANEEKDGEAFVQLMKKIRNAIEIQEELDYHKEMIGNYEGLIAAHREDIKEKKNELKNELYFHKIIR